MDTFKNIEDCGIGNVVDISDIESMQSCTIQVINPSGTTIKLASGQITVVSNKSPARLAEDKPIELSEDGIAIPKKPGRKRNGVELKIEFPEQPFTINDLATINNVTYAQCLPIVKEKCLEAGYAPKPKGQRGKSARLYIYHKE